MADQGWGNAIADAEAQADQAVPYAIELPIGYTLQEGYEGWVPAEGLKGAALAEAAHREASSIVWRNATGEESDDCPVATALYEIALHVRWRMIARGRSFTATKSAGGHVMGAFGTSLEAAALHILKNQMPLSTMVKYRA